LERDVGGFYESKMKKLEIDSQKAAKFEVNWWKAHHYGDKKDLIINLLRHNQTLYGINIISALILVKMLVPAAKAHNYKDKVNALNHMTKYYESVKHHLDSEMIPEKVAKAEVESWWVHDDLGKNAQESDLLKAFQKLYSNLLSMDETKVLKLSELKVNANINHDLAESTKDKDMENEYWEKTEDSLVEFYKELNILIRLAK
jgi:hypothetical protein